MEQTGTELEVVSTNPALQGWIERLTTTYSSQRLLALQGLLYKAHRAAGQVPLSGEILVQTLEVWAETLEPVPTMLLEGCYRQALHAKDNTFVVSAQDILVVYNRDMQSHQGITWADLAAGSEAYRATHPPRPPKPCEYPGCPNKAVSVIVGRYCSWHGDPKSMWREPKEMHRLVLELQGKGGDLSEQTDTSQDARL